jgi:hypothetical protein
MMLLSVKIGKIRSVRQPTVIPVASVGLAVEEEQEHQEEQLRRFLPS